MASLPVTGVQIIVLCLAGLLAGAINAIAGGGTFVSFPALLFCNVPLISANATNSLATWPGLVGATWEYKHKLFPHWRSRLFGGAVSVLGGVVGGLPVVRTPPLLFERLVPYLLLLGTAMLGATFFNRSPATPSHTPVEIGIDHIPQRPFELRSLTQFAVAVYGGYFVGGVGILQIAALSFFGVEDVRLILGVKNHFGVLMGAASLATLIASGKIAWPQASLLPLGTIVGSILGGRAAQRN